MFTGTTWGWFPIWRAYFSKGLKPPTSFGRGRISLSLSLYTAYESRINLDVAMQKMWQKEYEYRFQWHGIFNDSLWVCLKGDIRGVSGKQEVSCFLFPENLKWLLQAARAGSFEASWKIGWGAWTQWSIQVRGIRTYQRYHACRTFTQEAPSHNTPIQNKGLFTDFFTLKKHHVNHDFFLGPFQRLFQVSNEKHLRCLGYIGPIGDYTTGLCGDYLIRHEIRIPIEQPGFDGNWLVATQIFFMITPTWGVNFQFD